MNQKIKNAVNNELIVITALVTNHPLRDKIVEHLKKIKVLLEGQGV